MTIYVITETIRATFLIEASSEEDAFVKIDELNLFEGRKEVIEAIRIEVVDVQTILKG